DMAQDLERYLKDEPIRAKRPTLVQRVKKWARRHPGVALTAAAAIVALSTLGLAGTLVSNRLIEQQRNKALEAQDEATRRLCEALLGKAQGKRLSRRDGQRFESLEAIVEAAKIARDKNMPEERLLELRNEAIAALALTDLRLVRDGAVAGNIPGVSDAIDIPCLLEPYPSLATTQ